MHPFIRSTSVVAALLCAVFAAQAQSLNQESKEATGTISGRVTLAGKPMQGVTVMLSPYQQYVMERLPAQKVTTDEDGRFRATGLAAGKYTVATFAPALVAPFDAHSWQPGRLVTLNDGEQIEGVNFSLMRGGVITGRVTDADGRPLINQHINLSQIVEQDKRHPINTYNSLMYETDDRGVYRIYGLPPGRYLISAGEATGEDSLRIGSVGSGYYTRTFHPNATEESKAAIIEVTAESEATGIDIVMSRASKTYTATGRILDSETNKPVANTQVGHSALRPDGKSMSGFGSAGDRTNAKGEFRIEGLRPGHYAAYAFTEGESDSYNDPARFEVTNANVSGLEIKVRRGSSINGIAMVEGTTDSEILAMLSDLQLSVFVISQELSAPRITPIKIAPDGSFSIRGLRPGKARIWLGGSPPPKGFSILRIERDGVEQREGIEVAAGEQVSGVSLVIAYGTGVIRGQVNIQGGEFPDGTQLRVRCNRAGKTSQGFSAAEVDAKGRFVIEGLSAGEYELMVISLSSGPPPLGGGPPLRGGGPPPRIPPTKQTVTVTQGGTSNVTITLNLAAKDKDGM